MLTFAELLLRHLRLLIEETPLEDTAEVLVILVHRLVAEGVPVYTIYDGHGHDGSGR